MKTLNRYIASSFLVTFFMGLLILSFVMSVGLLFKATAYIAAGASPALVARFLWSGFPGTLSVSIPIAALVSALLVFGRLSSDSEISAMRACGISLPSIMRVPVMVATLLSLICMHLNSSVAPESAYARRSIRRLVSLSDILAVIEPGKFIDDFPGVQFFVGARDDQKLTDVRIIEPLGPGQKREIKAKTAYISSEEGRIKLDLSDVSINPISKTNSDVGHAARVVRYLGDEINEGRGSEVPRRLKDRLSADLLTEVLVARDSPPALDDEEAVLTLSQVRTELSNRTVMALSCLCFILIGIPLGIKTHRRESTIGVVIALAVAAAFFLFLIAAESLAKMPRFYPDLIAWVPVVVSFVLSNVLVFRNP